MTGKLKYYCKKVRHKQEGKQIQILEAQYITGTKFSEMR